MPRQPRDSAPQPSRRHSSNTAMSNLQSFVNKTVTILTSDGRTLTGKLLGHDQTTNLILSETIERIFTSASAGPDDPTQQVEHGLYLIRGDNVAVCGLVDDELDAGIDWSQVRAEPLGGMKHT